MDGRGAASREAAPPVIRVAGLSKRYGDAQILDDVTFEVPAGQVVALLGANGAGKTTTLKSILGVIRFDGSVAVAGIDVRAGGKDARRHIGYVPQTPALGEGDTCEQALSFLAALKGVGSGRLPELLEIVHLTEQRKTKVGHLSGGMRQRLTLAAALLADPPVLLLDEPTASLDVESRRDLQELIVRLRGEGKTVVLSTHVFEHLDELADRALILHRGRLVFDGTLDDLAQRSHSNRYVINLNGNAREPFIDALRIAGIAPEQVQRARPGWEEIILSSVQAAAEDGEESP